MRSYRAILMALMSLGLAVARESRTCGAPRVPVTSRQSLNRVFWTKYDQSIKRCHMLQRVRPQIFLAILCLTILAVIAVFKGNPEISTATIGGIIALGMKILEAE